MCTKLWSLFHEAHGLLCRGHGFHFEKGCSDSIPSDSPVSESSFSSGGTLDGYVMYLLMYIQVEKTLEMKKME